MNSPTKIAVWLPISRETIDEIEDMRLTREQGPIQGPRLFEIDEPYEREVRGRTVLVPWPGRPAGRYRRARRPA